MSLLVKKFKIRNSQKGFAALFITVIILAIIFAIAMPLIILVLGQQRIIINLTNSTQAYFTAEAGIEDALLRLRRGMKWTDSYSFSPENATVEIIISDVITGTRKVTATGNSSGRFRKVQVAYEFSGLEPGFNYGAQVGDGGLIIEDNSGVEGNVFSNGDVRLSDPFSRITNTVIVASAGKKLFGKGSVGEDAYADICQGEGGGQRIDVTGTLYANTVTNCNYNLLQTPVAPIDPIPLPITDSEIQEFKDVALEGGTTSTYSINSGTHYLGPIKIDGNLTVEGTAQLIITGTVWVTGEIRIRKNVKLDVSYGSDSGIIVGDNIIVLDNNSISSGSGAEGSYLMYVSTSLANPAITIMNAGTRVDVLYSNSGWVRVQDASNMRAVYAHGIHIMNSALLIYEDGLKHAFFTAGPGAGWTVTSWREIE